MLALSESKNSNVARSVARNGASGVTELLPAFAQGDRDAGSQRVPFAGDQRSEQGVLRVEILVDRPEGQPRFTRHVGNCRTVKTVARKHFLGRRHDVVAPPRLLLVADDRPAGRARIVGHRSTKSSRRPIVSMNSETISSTTEAVGCTLFIDPTTWPTK